MVGCFTPECRNPTREREAFCRDCFRLIPQDHRDHLRMVHRSPFYGREAFALEVTAAPVNVLWVWKDGDGHGVKARQEAAEILAWVELNLALQACGRAVWRRLRRRAARARIKDRRAA